MNRERMLDLFLDDMKQTATEKGRIFGTYSNIYVRDLFLIILVA